MKQLPINTEGRLAKRGLDIFISIVLLILFSPLLSLLMVAIKLESPGPALSRQPRRGLDGRAFWVLKLRTNNRTEVTPFGSLLRKIYLDEIPQLLNVLKGDMSVVELCSKRPQR